jgi:hypothetical protein
MNERKKHKDDDFFDQAERTLMNEGKISNRQILFVLRTKGGEIMRDLINAALENRKLSDIPKRESMAEKIVQLRLIRALRSTDETYFDDKHSE